MAWHRAGRDGRRRRGSLVARDFPTALGGQAHKAAGDVAEALEGFRRMEGFKVRPLQGGPGPYQIKLGWNHSYN